jgi:hypothetical protein
MAKAKHEWAKLDPRIHSLKGQDWTDTRIAEDLGIARQTLVDHLRSHEATGTLQGTQQVPRDRDASMGVFAYPPEKVYSRY